MAGTATVSYISASTFSPTDIAGLLSWYDAQDSSKVTKDVSDNVATWIDKGSAGVNVDWNATTKPIWKSASNINSKNAIRFVGGDYLSKASLPATSINQFTVFLVLNQATTANYATVLGLGGVGDEPLIGLSNLGGGGSTNVMQLYSAGSHFGSTTISTGTSYYLTYRQDGAPLFRYRVNGTDDATTPTGVGTITPGSAKTYVGGDGTENFVGDLGEVLLYDSLLSSANISAVESYLSVKWGI